ncbi:DNA polymerase III subunit delta' C-terminal domain-containing protein [Vibrio quintilis]|uniref:DNA polymerase III subunit delta' n=1 Tax=Vibrio quintilis TaxID=1117707 RepID=A0A1M7YU25_9VIBR|nr:DNA polymerase III subunit delta' C-terminal domain-containing protein [Vibrio quintilis]SHO56016.1 DNA polymerase III subunit delta' [Vibrio quintilis]
MSVLYPWFRDTWEQWNFSRESNLLSLASLLVVKEGMGEDDFVHSLAMSLLCTGEQKPCGHCHSCQLMEKKVHPDFHIIEPEKTGKQITVDQIRQMNQLAQESSQFAGDRVMVIRPADQLNQSAGNALLKTLEDSSEQCRFILLTAHVDRMLPTILSRCRRLVVQQPSHQDIAQWLYEETTQHVPSYVLTMNGFAPLRVLEFIRHDRLSDYQLLAGQFCQFLEEPLRHASSLTKLIEKSPAENLTWLWYLLADSQKCQFQLKDESFLPESVMIAQKASYELLYQQFQLLSALLKQVTVQSSLNSELLILDWLLKFDEVSCSSTPTAI